MKATLPKDNAATVVARIARQENDCERHILMPSNSEQNPLLIPKNASQWDDYWERERWWNAIINEFKE